jgi:MazG family protein
MSLRVVVVGPDEVGKLSLREHDALLECERVLFERPDHPLAQRLREAGVHVSRWNGDVPAEAGTWGVVVDPGSSRVVELAKNGADVTTGFDDAPDPLTAAYGAYVARRAGEALARLGAVMARLRGADGCPWDRQQTHASLKPHLLEEAYEVIDVIERGSLTDELEEELGDLLLQVAFHAELAAQQGRFDLAGVADRIVAKLIHRHPHVFGDVEAETAGDVVRSWESIKAREKGRADPFDGIPAALPALVTASKVQKRAAAVGFAASEEESRARLRAAIDDGDLGEALFWLVAAARASGVDPEGALREATARFRRALQQ